jgi:hypothetical protein
MGLTEDLHNLVDSPPPPSFELDDLMRRRRIRPARSRVLLGIAGFAAVALVLVGGYLLKPGTNPSRPTVDQFGAGSPTPSVTPTPTATPADYDTIAKRLDAVLAKLPNSLYAPTDGSAKFRWQSMTGATPPVQYYASWKHKGVTYGINVYNSGEKPNPAENGCKPPYAGELDCHRTVDKAGITYLMNNAKDKLDPVVHTKASVLEVFYCAADGTQINISESAGSKYILPVSGTVAMAQAAHLPGLDLKP